MTNEKAIDLLRRMQEPEEDIGLVDTVIEAEGDKKQDGESDN